MKYKNKDLINNWLNKIINNGSNYNNSLSIRENRLYNNNLLLGYFSNNYLYLSTNNNLINLKYKKLVNNLATNKGIQIMYR